MTLTDLKNLREDTEAYHAHINDLFTQLVNQDPVLDAHRTYIDQNIFGMGERSFHYMWKLICESLPENPKLMEIGIWKGNIPSLWKLLRPDAHVYGISPLDGRGTGWTSDDYATHIKRIHADFDLTQPTLIVGASEEDWVIDAANKIGVIDLLYVDGDHSHMGALSDLVNYTPMIKSGGWLIVDDAACRTKQRWGVFQGIAEVCQALEDWESTDLGKEFEFQFNVVHNMVYRRK